MTSKILTISFIATIIVLMLAAITNPSREEHRDAVSKLVGAYMSHEANKNKQVEGLFEKASEEIGLAIEGALVNKTIDNTVDHDNYVIFSFTTLNWEEEDRIIGIGLFGKVIIQEDLENILNKRKMATY